jgi:hypothetical protein
MNTPKLKMMLSLGAILLAFALFYLRMFERGPEFELRPHLAAGEVLADLAAKSVGQGGRITLIAPDTSIYEWPAAASQLKGFYRALRRANLQVSATNLIKLDPIRLIRVPPQEFLRLIRKQNEADVIVSFLGPPIPTAEEKMQLRQKHGRVIALCSGDLPRQVNLKALIEERWIEAAIISRPLPPPGLPQSDHLPDWFAHFFEVITMKNAADLPAHARGAAR